MQDEEPDTIPAVRVRWGAREVATTSGAIIAALALAYSIATGIAADAISVAKTEGLVTRELLASKLDALRESFEAYVRAQERIDGQQDKTLSEIRTRQDDVRERLRVVERMVDAPAASQK